MSHKQPTNGAKILFACSGNTCRSCMAENIFKRKTSKKDIEASFEVESAGIYAIDGMGPSNEAVEVVKEQGGDLSSHKSRQLTPNMLDKADFIFTMTFSQKRDIIKLKPEAYRKTFVIKEFIDLCNKEEFKTLTELYRKEGFMYEKLKAFGDCEQAGDFDSNKLYKTKSDTNEAENQLYEIRKKINEFEKQVKDYEIRDPFGGTYYEYEKTYREIDSAIEYILEELKQRSF